MRIAATRLLFLACAFLAAGGALAQVYPVKPVRVVTASAGGALDITLRLIAQGISGSLGQQVIIENRPSSVHPEDALARAAPDGYSLLYYANTLWLAPFLRAKLPYDPQKDFAPICLTVRGPNVIVVHTSLPVKSVAELVALAKAKPSELNVAITGVGTSPTMAAVLFQSMTGAKLTNIAYKGSAQAFNDLRAGRVEVMFPTVASSLPLVRSGQVRALAVTSAEPSPLAPDLPTAVAAGIPGYESVAIHGLFAPAKTPQAIITRLNQEVVKFLTNAEAKDKINKMGFDIIASTPDQLSATIKAEMERMGKVIREAGLQPQ
ncbi:MAG: tripartite tricarboxylate transporter substrate-binding protein [Pseudomonadota bacterium]